MKLTPASEVCPRQPAEPSVALTTMVALVLLYNSTYSSSEPLPMIPDVGPRKRNSLISTSPGLGVTVRMKVITKLPLKARFAAGPKLRLIGKKMELFCTALTL